MTCSLLRDRVFNSWPNRERKVLRANGYIVRPAPGIKPRIHRVAYRLPKGPKSREMVCLDDGIQWWELKTSDAEVLRGKASTFWDLGRRKQIADVVALRVECGKP